MNEKEFINMAQNTAPAELRNRIPEVVGILKDIGIIRCERHELSNVILLTSRWPNIEEMDVEERIGSLHESSVVSEFLVDLIMPWVEDIRRELFGSPDIPFHTFNDMKTWWRQALDENNKWLEEQRKVQYSNALFQMNSDETTPIGSTLRSSWGIPTSVSPERAYSGLLNYLHVGYTPPYTILLFRTDEISYATGFIFIDVFFHILSDWHPTLKRYDIVPEQRVHKLPSGNTLINRFVSVDIRGEMNFEELHGVYQEIRQGLEIKRTKAFNEKHLEIYKLVQKMGGPPKRKGVVKFWNMLREEWNKKHIDDPYETWKGLKIAYERLYNKLSSQYLLRAKDEDKPKRRKLKY